MPSAGYVMRLSAISPLWMACALSAVAGMADSAGFILLDGLFVAHVTGNFVLIGAAAVRGSSGILSKILTLPAFFFGVVFARLGGKNIKVRSDAVQLSILLAAEAAMLFFIAAIGYLMTPGSNSDPLIVSSLGCVGAFAMGIQNAVGRLHLAQLPASTVMTVNAAQFAIDAVDVGLSRLESDAHRKARQRLQNVGRMITSFACGALSGAIGAMHLKFFVLLIPCLVLCLLALTDSKAAA
jgi:uncharacterized membrane protein YoaK (UPF0700 family)